MEPQQIVLRPVLTEKATRLTDRNGRVTFRVTRRANKHQIRDAIEALYGVVVVSVRTMVVRGKVKRKGASFGKQATWKKALITLRSGDVIDFFATE